MIRAATILTLIAGLAAYFGLWYQVEDGPGAPAPLTNSTGEPVSVNGSQIQFMSKAKQNVGDREVSLTITGTALRTKFGIKIYAMGSYLEDGATVASAEELAAAEKVKLMHLVMERKATGSDFIDAFRTGVGKDRAKGELGTEFAKLTAAFGDASAEKGDYVLLLYIPEVGTRIRLGEKVDVTIPGTAFGHAIWETYLGSKPVDKEMKQNLVSQITK